MKRFRSITLVGITTITLFWLIIDVMQLVPRDTFLLAYLAMAMLVILALGNLVVRLFMKHKRKEAGGLVLRLLVLFILLIVVSHLRPEHLFTFHIEELRGDQLRGVGYLRRVHCADFAIHCPQPHYLTFDKSSQERLIQAGLVNQDFNFAGYFPVFAKDKLSVTTPFIKQTVIGRLDPKYSTCEEWRSTHPNDPTGSFCTSGDYEGPALLIEELK